MCRAIEAFRPQLRLVYMYIYMYMLISFAFYMTVDFPTPMVGFPALNPKNAVVTNTLAPEVCAEWSDREIHSSHGDYICDDFYVYVSGPKS